ncbi:MAG TPA: phage virion morphogenesis protein [Fibrobacteria bacterium]|nr:phage virion morphogenesis protein [Fibrobacteria bacterium]
MSGFQIQLSGNAIQSLQRLVAAGGNLSQPMRVISQKLLNSVRKNFRTGGRYSWAGSIEGGSAQWRPAANPPSRGSTLYRHGHLFRSILPDSNFDSASVSTNVEYAAIHNFGGPILRRGRQVATMVARPFMVIQPEDMIQAQVILERHLRRAFR